MDEAETAYLEELKAAMKDPGVSLRPVHTFTHGLGIQVYVKTRKVGPILFPGDGKTIPDLMHMLGTMMIAEPPTKP